MDLTAGKNKKMLFASCCIFLFIGLPTALSFFSESFADFIISASDFTKEYEDYFLLWRISLYVTTIFFWNELCRALAKGNNIFYKQLIKRVWIVIALFLIVELKNYL